MPLASSGLPAGGVGYEDSSLPYDDVEPLSAALQTVRAQALRFHPDTVFGLVGHLESETQKDAVLVLSASAADAQTVTLDELAKKDARVANAIQVIHDNGLTIRTEVRDVPSINQVCQLQDAVLALADTGGPLESVYTETHVSAGTVRVRASEDTFPLITEAAGKLAGYIEPIYVEQQIDYGRFDDYSPWNGGNYVNARWGSSGNCTNSFRLNGNTTLIAAHCGTGEYYSPYCDVFCNSSDWVGTAGYTLAGVSVDAMVLHGSSYTRNVWIGGTSTSSSLPAYGVYPWYTLPYGAQLLVSGSTTGQGTVEFRGTPPDGCVMREGAQRCQLISTVAPSSIGAGGDSGGPGAVYDPTNGRLIPVGIIQGGTSPVGGSHWLDLTTTQAIVYLYGGATIG